MASSLLANKRATIPGHRLWSGLGKMAGNGVVAHTSKYAAILTFPLSGDFPHKTDLSTICQLLRQADARKLRTLPGGGTLMKILRELGPPK
jgi:hypothetical protein